ncbi:bifunctional DNA primase/polymerase [Magnetococcales bacterium HHB-1]
MERSKLEHALAMAELGFKVFPLEQNSKRPVIDGWQRRASRDPERIKKWWLDPVMGWTQDFNIAITGGLFIDVDRKNGTDGQKTLDFLTESHGELPVTLAVKTPNGGNHLYFKEDPSIRNSVNKLGPGLDVRSINGYVVAPGSTINGREYQWINNGATDISTCPEWLADMLRDFSGEENRSQKSIQSIELDKPTAIQRATHFLENEAPTATEGAGGDDTTFRIAAMVKDYGVSEATCLELMLDHWNERCSPPWSPEALSIKVANAYRYGAAAIGIASPEADFQPVTPTKQKETSPLAPQQVEPFDPSSLPPREWVLGTLMLKKNVSVTIAPPSAGKSTLTLLAAVAIVSGRGDLIGMKLHRRERVWLYNNEDDVVEMKRRLSAILTHFKLNWKDLEINGEIGLYINSGEDRPLTIARRAQDGKGLTPFDMKPLISFMRSHEIGVLIADPFLETHEASENSNEEINRVARMFRTIAKHTNSAVMLVHHTRKLPQGNSEGHAGNMDSARGASALMGVARIANTLYAMSGKDAEAHGIPEQERHLYVRLDDAKANMALLDHKPKWFKKISVRLPHSRSGKGLNFDEVGVLEPFQLQSQNTPDFTSLIEDVAEVMENDRETAVTLAKRLIKSNPIYMEKKHLSLSRTIIKSLQTPKIVEGWKFEYAQGHAAKEKHLIVREKLTTT